MGSPIWDLQPLRLHVRILAQAKLKIYEKDNGIPYSE
jgi:hypothetical protein